MIKQMSKSRKIAYILESLVSVTGIIFVILNIFGYRHESLSVAARWASALVMIPIGLIMPTVERGFKYEFPLILHGIVFSYVLLSVIIGSALGVNHIVIGFDKILHGLLGYVLCILAMYIAIRCKIWDKSLGGNLWIMFAVSMAYASVWEIFEYACDNLLGQNMQRGSLDDTMLDMISHFGVTILFLIHYLVDVKTKLNLGMKFMVDNLSTGGSLRVTTANADLSNGICGADAAEGGSKDGLEKTADDPCNESEDKQ